MKRVVLLKTVLQPNVDEESPFLCQLVASSDIGSDMYFRSVFAIWKMELAGDLYLCPLSS